MSSDRETLIQLVEECVTRLRARQVIEEPKLEIKQQWPSLGLGEQGERKIQESEFAKDLAAMANTHGPDTGYLIYGLTKDGGLVDARFSSCGLRDVADLQKLVVRTIDKPVDFEHYDLDVTDDGLRKVVSILVVPRSPVKPHVVRCLTRKTGHYIENYIPIRKTTSVVAATRSDLEQMFWERGLAHPEYALRMTSHKPGFAVNAQGAQADISFPVVLENCGQKPVAVVEGLLEIEPSPEQGITQMLSGKLTKYNEQGGRGNDNLIQYCPLKVPSGDVQPVLVHFTVALIGTTPPDLRKAHHLVFTIRVTDTNGKEYRSLPLTTFG